MDTKKVLTDEDLADLAVAQRHIDIARKHRQLASDALARVKKRHEPEFDMYHFDPFDLGE
jgi:hypothetical protein